MRYCIQNKNTPLIEFDVEIKTNIINGIQTKTTNYSIHKIHEGNKSIFPKDLIEYTGEAVQQWLKKRKAPKNRQFVNKILSIYENSTNPLTFLDVTHALSLNDTFWINCLDAPLKWEDCSLYTHNFSEILAYVAFTGNGSNKIKGVISSPEFTTGGAQKKCWSKRKEGIFLIKGVSALYEHLQNQGRTDVIAEYCASQIADEMKINHIKYDLEMFKHYDGSIELVSKCQLFTSEKEGYLPFYIYSALNELPVNKIDLSDYVIQIKLAELYGREAFEDMMIFDSLILNTDRHMTNFGMIINNDTGEILRPAPLFDHGNSLLVGAAKSDIDNPEEYITTIESQFGINFDEQAYRFVQSRHLPMLQNIRSFYFERHPLAPEADEYMTKLERYLHTRALHIMDLYQTKKEKSKTFEK